MSSWFRLLSAGLNPVLAILMALACASANAAETSSDPLGRLVAPFEAKDFRGKTHRLADFADDQLLVVAFLGTECPLAKLYGPRIQQLAQAYADRGVGFLGVNANVQDSITELAAYARIHGLTFPLVKDLGNRIADQIGAVRTPEVFLLDADRKIRYWGRIDDQYDIGIIRDEPKQRYLVDAIEALLADKSVDQPHVSSIGCYIGRVVEPDETSEVTYSNQIARIFQRRCVECHRSGEIAPFALTRYDEVVGWAETILEVVEDRRMPPWHADPRHGQFVNDRRLSDDELSLIRRWVRAGAPEGDAQQLPPPRTFVTGWQLPREPELVISMRDKPFSVPAEGTVKYQYFLVDPEFKQDRWVKAAEVVPGNRAVVHHVLVFVKTPGVGRRASQDLVGDFLAAYVPGARGMVLPKGMAKFVPGGSQIVFQVHYTPIGSPQEDLSKVGLIFADEDEVTHQVMTSKAINHRLRIPPHEENYRVEATSKTAPRDVWLLNLMPHMHLRGKAFRYDAVFSDGKRETLLDVPHYDFNWQTGYQLAQPRRLPTGTRIHCVAHYDNSKNNLANPDPTATVGWGDQTWNEMMIGYFDIAIPVEAFRKQMPEDRPLARRVMQRFDKNADGKLARDEVPPRMIPLFDRVDRDGNKIVTQDELAAGLPELTE